MVAAMGTLNPILLTRSALEQAVVRGVREVGRLNAALLAPQDPDAPRDPFRPALTVPVEETWTLRRLFGRINVYATQTAEAA
jgi:hypothetical protein